MFIHVLGYMNLEQKKKKNYMMVGIRTIAM